MDRRGFLKGLAALVGGIALEEAIPLGRVWSFPKELKVSGLVAEIDPIFTPEYLFLNGNFVRNGRFFYYDPDMLEVLKRNFVYPKRAS